MIRKRRNPSGEEVWGYCFEAPGSTRETRAQIRKWGFAKKAAAVAAEAQRRIDAQRQYEAELAGVSKPLPHTLRQLLSEFFLEHGERNLAPKTLHRYRELAHYVSAELMDMRIDEITPLHLTREWNRLRDTGGHHRRSKQARPLAAKTVRHIAGLVSSVFHRGVSWGLVASNPVTRSDRPRQGGGRGIALSVEQQALVLKAANEDSVLPIVLELAAATGARRGEILALRWSDVCGGLACFERSLSQAGAVLEFKSTKTGRPKILTLPESTVRILERHRLVQLEWRKQFGPMYRADLDLIVCNEDGSPVRPDSISSMVSALCRRLKMPKGVSLHTLRHSHGSQLLAGGMELSAVSERLGHSSTAMTAKVYAHALKGRDAEAAKVWERMQGRDRGQAHSAEDQKSN